MEKILSFSGGKDSTALLLKLIEETMQLDEVIWVDTFMEFPEMYDHINKVEDYIKRPITRLTPNEKEKLKAEINDYFQGLNSVGDIDYTAYSDIYDAVMPIIDNMYKRMECEENEGHNV